MIAHRGRDAQLSWNVAFTCAVLHPTPSHCLPQGTPWRVDPDCVWFSHPGKQPYFQPPSSIWTEAQMQDAAVSPRY